MNFCKQISTLKIIKNALYILLKKLGLYKKKILIWDELGAQNYQKWEFKRQVENSFSCELFGFSCISRIFLRYESGRQNRLTFVPNQSLFVCDVFL